MSDGGALPAQAPPLLPANRAAPVAWRAWLPACAPLGPGVATAALAGATLSFLLPAIPPLPWLAGATLIAMLAWWRLPHCRLLAALLGGFAWAALQGGASLAQRLPASMEGGDLAVEAQVLGLPVEEGRRLRMDLRLLAVPDAPMLKGRRVRVARYGDGPPMAPGSRWALSLRLKRPRGLANPGGFDFERFALERRIVA